MVKRILCLFVAVILLLSLFVGCGTSSRKADTARGEMSAKMEQAQTVAGRNGSMGGEGNGSSTAAAAPAEQPKSEEAKAEPGAAVDADSIAGSGSAGQSFNNAILAQRKVIRNANVAIEVEDFDVAYGKINTIISNFGFVQQSNIKKDKVYVNNEMKLITKGVIVIRIDKTKFDSVMHDLKGLGTVLDENINVEDVSGQYFDVESRLRLLRFEEGRLEEYLKKQTDPKFIFETERQLTNIRHEIESLTGTLQKWNDLIALSTITINMNEKIPGAVDQPAKEKTYWQRLLNNFLDSIKGVVSFCGELLMLLVQAIPVLILLGAFVLIVLAIYRRVSKGTAITKNKDNNNPM